MEKEIKLILLRWYCKNKRDLPWRKIHKNKLPNPYFVFVSEYMLQQTTVSSVKTKFNIFVKKWPNLDLFAKSNNSTVLRFWSGLGYYKRATNLLKAAKIIKKNFKSKIPSNYEDLFSLPGVGDYTAKAVLGIAYNKPVMPIDSNIERIISRIYCLKLPLKKIKNDIKIISKSFISQKNSTNLIQAFMDYGSIICTPKKPDCINCIIKLKCESYKNNFQNLIPNKSKIRMKKIKKYSRAYIVKNEHDEILVRKRSSIGMLPSMLEVPNDKWVNNKKNLLNDEIFFKIKNKFQYKGIIEYSFSHIDLETEIFYTEIKKISFSNLKWIKINRVNKSELSTLMKKIIKIALKN